MANAPASALSTGIVKINHELAQGPEGAQRALALWMMQCASVRTPDFRRNAPAAARLNAALSRILATGIDPDFVQSSTTALCVCAMKDNVRGMRKLINAGASLGRVASTTPLVTALAHCRDDALRFALAAGSDPLLANAGGTTPAQMALQTMNFTGLAELFSLGATINPASPGHPHPVAEVIGVWFDENMPRRVQENCLKRLIELPGCDLDVDASCKGMPAPEAIEKISADHAPQVLARARQVFLNNRVDDSLGTRPPAPPKRM